MLWLFSKILSIVNSHTMVKSYENNIYGICMMMSQGFAYQQVALEMFRFFLRTQLYKVEVEVTRSRSKGERSVVKRVVFRLKFDRREYFNVFKSPRTKLLYTTSEVI